MGVTMYAGGVGCECCGGDSTRIAVFCCDAPPGTTLPRVLHATKVSATGACTCLPDSIELVYNDTYGQWEYLTPVCFCDPANPPGVPPARAFCGHVGTFGFEIDCFTFPGPIGSGSVSSGCPTSWSPLSVLIDVQTVTFCSGTVQYLITE